jgi:hypothetical protein
MTEFRAPEVNNGKIIAEFRANGGKVGGPFVGADMLLLHPTGVGGGFARYEVRAAPRKIPVVVLDPVK